jgi:hypothetical protein
MEKNILVPRLFVTPTIHNEYFTARDLFVAVDGYLNSMALYCRSHLVVDRATEMGRNKHEHDIVMVWSDELKEFNLRYYSFCNETAYPAGDIHVMDFDDSRIVNASMYLGKHEPIPEQYNRQVYCSNRYQRCKKDKHICRYDINNPIHLKPRLK